MAASTDAETARHARGRKDRQADRREVILEAAARRFAEFGFEATTVRQIAGDVNILSGSLYHPFAVFEQGVRDGLFHPGIDSLRSIRGAARTDDPVPAALSFR